VEEPSEGAARAGPVGSPSSDPRGSADMQQASTEACSPHQVIGKLRPEGEGGDRREQDWRNHSQIKDRNRRGTEYRPHQYVASRKHRSEHQGPERGDLQCATPAAAMSIGSVESDAQPERQWKRSASSRARSNRHSGRTSPDRGPQWCKCNSSGCRMFISPPNGPRESMHQPGTRTRHLSQEHALPAFMSEAVHLER
jgi:hypothetical protein